MRYRTREVSIHLYKNLMLQRIRGVPGPQISKADENGNRYYGIGKAPTPEERDAEALLWIERLESLAGKLLLCWCTPEPCHGNVLAEMAACTKHYRRELRERIWMRNYKNKFRK
jgi:hypothetical protein